MDPDPRLDRWMLSLAGKARPKACFVPTASGDNDHYIVRFYNAFQDLDAEPDHLPLFTRRHAGDALREHVLAQDLLYVGGGNTANMLAVWRAHGLDTILEEAWRAGVILCGLSAGSLCWFEGGVTDSFGEALQVLPDGLGLLPGSHCPHYDGEAQRRPAYSDLVARGTLPPGYAVADGVALRFEGTRHVETVRSRPTGGAWHVRPDATAPDGVIHEALPCAQLAEDGTIVRDR